MVITSLLFLIVEHNVADLRAAYNRGADIVGYDWAERACAEYGETTISPEIYNHLNAFFDMTKYAYMDSQDDISYYLMDDIGSFAEIWLEIAKQSEPALEWNIINPANRAIPIGGYGLFWS